MAAKKTLTVAEVAQQLGMKEREVVDVRADAEGVLAQTHDQNWTLIRDGGVLEFLGQDVGERVAEAPAVEAPAKAPKGRG